MIEIYTDGSCIGNPGMGGWAYVITENDKVIITGDGYEFQTTNNRMELQAAIKALLIVVESNIEGKIKVVSDSAYVVNAFHEKWIDKWIKRGWINTDGKAVSNQDLWLQLINLVNKTNCELSLIKRNVNVHNKMADTLARKAAKSKRETSRQQL